MLVDTNVLIRHLTGEPAGQARRAGELIAAADEGALIVTDVVVAECAYVLESAYELDRDRVASLLLAIVGARQVRVAHGPLLERAVEIYAEHGLDFADAYLCALDLFSDAGPIASFDRGLDAVPGVGRREP
jgi:predicted nucleic-acid-binding protein